jgi:hypothetical protein
MPEVGAGPADNDVVAVADVNRSALLEIRAHLQVSFNRPRQAEPKVCVGYARRELSPAAARDLPLWANPITQRVLTLAAEAERRHTS